MQIWYLSPMRAAKVQASLRNSAVSPELLLLAHTSSESRGTFRQKARSLAPLNGWACTVKICHDGMLEDTNSLDALHNILLVPWFGYCYSRTNKKGGYFVIIKGQFCLFLHKNICCGYSLESPCQGDSKEYPQHTFLWRTDEN